MVQQSTTFLHIQFHIVTVYNCSLLVLRGPSGGRTENHVLSLFYLFILFRNIFGAELRVALTRIVYLSRRGKRELITHRKPTALCQHAFIWIHYMRYFSHSSLSVSWAGEKKVSRCLGTAYRKLYPPVPSLPQRRINEHALCNSQIQYSTQNIWRYLFLIQSTSCNTKSSWLFTKCKTKRGGCHLCQCWMWLCIVVGEIKLGEQKDRERALYSHWRLAQ